MNEFQTILSETIQRLLSDHVSRDLIVASEQGKWAHDLWTALEENGLTKVLVSEAGGGAGAQWSDAALLIKAAGEHGAPVPFGETIVAAWLLDQAGLPVPDGAMTLLEGGDLSLTTQGDGFVLDGQVAGVPWASSSKHGIAMAQGPDGDMRLCCISLSDVQLIPGMNVAREARDRLVLEKTHVIASAPCGSSVLGTTLRHWGALIRALQMGGALQRLLEQSVAYANERTQFGKPIGKFQAIQQQLSVLATQAAATGVATNYAAQAVEKGRLSHEIAIAKVRADEAANIATSIAHQVHGAIGFTYEHTLHFATRRLWSWRAEYGAGCDWAAELGAQILQNEPEALWPLVTQK